MSCPGLSGASLVRPIGRSLFLPVAEEGGNKSDPRAVRSKAALSEVSPTTRGRGTYTYMGYPVTIRSMTEGMLLTSVPGAIFLRRVGGSYEVSRLKIYFFCKRVTTLDRGKANKIPEEEFSVTGGGVVAIIPRYMKRYSVQDTSA